MATKMYSKEVVWASAAAAQRINQKYINWTKNMGRPVIPAQPTNIVLMRTFFENPTTLLPEDFQRGASIRNYFIAQIHQVLSGEAQPFTVAAVEAASIEEFDFKNSKLPLIASLPQIWERAQQRQQKLEQLNDLKSTSALLAWSPSSDVHSKTPYFSGYIQVLDCVFSRKYHTYSINAVHTSNDINYVLFFFYHVPMEINKTYNIYGRLKRYIGNTTQLSYVKCDECD